MSLPANMYEVYFNRHVHWQTYIVQPVPNDCTTTGSWRSLCGGTESPWWPGARCMSVWLLENGFKILSKSTTLIWYEIWPIKRRWECLRPPMNEALKGFCFIDIGNYNLMCLDPHSRTFRCTAGPVSQIYISYVHLYTEYGPPVTTNYYIIQI